MNAVGRRYKVRSLADLSQEERKMALAAYSLIDGGLYDLNHVDPPFDALTFCCLFLDAFELMLSTYAENAAHRRDQHT